MPDKNKLKVLQDIKYEIKRVCGNCKNADIHMYQDWGTCKIHKYQHGKHTGDNRGISIHKNGHCSDHDRELMETFKLGVHSQFEER